MSTQHPTRSRWPARSNHLLVFLAASLIGSICGLANPAVADPNPARSQQQLRQSTQTIAAQIDTLFAEFERNDLAGSDVEMLRAIRSVLTRLSDEEMQSS